MTTPDLTQIAVPPGGTPTAPLVIIGEAPGSHEIHARPPQPFVGPAGARLMEWLAAVGLSRTDVYLDNVYPYKPPNNKLAVVGRAALEPAMVALHERLARLPNPRLIVPLGNYPLYALLGLGQVAWHTKDGKQTRPGIAAHRGSLYEYQDLRGRRIRVIPSIHPSATFNQPTLELPCRLDWEKIKAELADPTKPLPKRTILSNPTPADVEGFIRRCEANPTALLTFDIERPAGTTTTKGKPTKQYPDGKPTTKKDYRAGKIVCVAFTLDAFRDTVVIPLQPAYWRRYGETADGTPLLDPTAVIRHLLALPNPKATQNGLYDVWHCEDYGWPVTNWVYDSLYLHHAINPRQRHSLEYMASVYLRTTYWKDESKDPESISGWTERQDTLRLYCGKDTSHTAELVGLFTARMDADTWTRYWTHYWALLRPLMAMMRHGFRVDVAEAARRTAALKAELAALRVSLKADTGHQLMATKALSNCQLHAYLYRTLKLPEQYKKDGRVKRVTADEVAIKRLALRFPDRFPPAVATQILRARRVCKLLDSYRSEHFDPDGRMRSTYSPNTQQGRLSSKKNPRGSGTNGQNTDQEARDIYLADEGCVLLVIDLSQAESRVNRAYIHALTGNEEALWKARALPADWDDHSDMTQRIFGVTDPAEIKANRPLGKMIVHASQRKMQGETLADKILKERGEVVLPEEATRLIQLAIDAQPGLPDFFRWVEYQIQQTRRLVSCWGVPLWFTYDRLDHATYRDGYSFIMQDAVGRLMSQRGLRWLWEATPLWQNGTIAVNGDWHDGVLLSVPWDPPLVADLCAGLTASLATPLDCLGVPLAIPSTVKIGRHAGGEHEWKVCPTEADLRAVMDDLRARPPLHPEPERTLPCPLPPPSRSPETPEADGSPPRPSAVWRIPTIPAG